MRGITVKGLTGTNAYLYLEGIETSPSKPPIARTELEIKQGNGIKRVMRKLGRNDNLFDLSGGLDQYSAIGVYNQWVFVSPRDGVTIVKLSATRAYGTTMGEDANWEGHHEAFLPAIAAHAAGHARGGRCVAAERSLLAARRNGDNRSTGTAARPRTVSPLRRLRPPRLLPPCLASSSARPARPAR